jgi:hypothetical protein
LVDSGYTVLTAVGTRELEDIHRTGHFWPAFTKKSLDEGCHRCASHELSLAQRLSNLVERLNGLRFCQDWRADGGKTEFEIMWSVGDAWPQESFSHNLLARLAEMKIDMSLQIIVIAE